MRSVIRNRRRTFSSILGVLLAITFIAGTFIAIDSAARGALNALLADVPGDFTVSTSRDSLGTLEEDVAAVPGVQSVVPVARLQMFEVGVWNRTVVTAEALAIDPANPPSPVAGGTVQGAMTLARGLVVLTEGAASLLDVAVGDTVYLHPWFGFFDSSVPGTAVNVTVEGILTLPVDSLPFIGRPGYEPALVLLHVRDVDWIRTEAAIPYPPFWQLEVWIDRDRFIDPYDFEATTRNLGRLRRQIEAVGINEGAYVNDNISNALLTYQASLGAQRIIFLLLSTPVILLGLYLGAVGVDLGHAERRRELAVLKTRGAGRRQVIVLLITEAVLGGLLAAVAGLALGVLLSRFVLAYVNPTFSAFVQVQYGDIVLSTDTILTVAVLSMLFMAAVSYRSAKRTAGLPIVETLRYYAPGETRIEYRPTADLIMVNLGVLTYAVVLYSRASPGGFFLFLVGVIFTVLLPFAPIFLTIGATRLATRSTGRVYEWASRACKPFAKNLYHVINRNLSRNPRRSANIAVIIALGLAFGVFTLAVLGSQQAYEVRQIRAGIGADAAIFGGTNDAVTADVRALPGVAAVTRIAAVPADTRPCCPGVWAVEPATFFAVTQPEPWYFDGIGAAEAQAVLARGDQVLVSKAFADQAFLAVGDRLTFALSVFRDGADPATTRVNATIGGIVRGLPGTDRYPYGLPTSVYGSVATFQPLFDLASAPGAQPGVVSESTLLVDFEPNADWRSVKASIVDLGLSPIVYEEEVQRAATNPFAQSFRGFIGMEVAFIGLILTAGLGLIIYAASLERDVEFAAIRARGSSGWQTAGILVGEAFAILLIALVIGVVVGLGTSWASLEIAQPTGTFEALVPFQLVLPLELLLLLALAPAAMLLTATVISVRVARMDVARVLKLRGG